MRTAIALAALIAGTAPAPATATLSCEVDDKTVTFDAQGSVAHGMGEALSGFQGKIQVRMNGLPADLGTFDFEREHLAHSWIHARDVRPRLRKHWRRPSPASMPAARRVAFEARRA